MKKFIVWLLIAALLVSAVPACETAAEEGEDGLPEITLTKVDSVDINAVNAENIKRVDVYANGLVATMTDGTYQILNYQGVNALGESYDKVKEFCNDTWLVYQADKGVNNCGLVRADGTVLIPVSAAIIDDVSSPGGYDWQNTVRYLEVTYGTEEVSDKNDAFFYVSDRISLMPQEGDKLYAGYALFYDLKLERFVPDLQRTSNTEPSYSVEVVGDKLYFGRRNVAYDENGAVFAELPRYGAYVVDGFMVVRMENGLYNVYDGDKQVIAADLEDQPANIYQNGQLFGYYGRDDAPATVRDKNGVQVSDLPFKYPPAYEHGSFLYGRDADDHYLVMDNTGKTLIDAEAGVSYVYKASLGYLKLEYEDGSYGLLYPDGTVVRGDRQRDLLLSEKRDNGVAVLVLKDRALTLELPETVYGPKPLLDDYEAAPLLFVGTKDGVVTLFNAANGEALLTSDARYEDDGFYFADGYLYALQGDVYDVYTVDYQY